MPLFAMISSCSMLFDSSEHCNLILFLLSLKLILFAILPCVLEHVLVISGDSSVFMFCCALPVHHAMPLFAMISSCNMLFDSSEHCNLMLFLQSLKLLLYAILPCVLEHVLMISGDSSVFMFCYALSVHHEIGRAHV